MQGSMMDKIKSDCGSPQALISVVTLKKWVAEPEAILAS
jgi:hypothetical protein